MPEALPLIPQDQAFQTLQEKVDLPVFFHKLATDYGVRPQNEEQALHLLSMGDKLLVKYQAEQVKAAAASGELFAQLDAELDGMAQQPINQQVKQAAYQAGSDPDLASAVLSLQYQAAQRQHQAAQPTS